MIQVCRRARTVSAVALLMASCGTAFAQTEVHWEFPVDDVWSNASRWNPPVVPNNNGVEYYAFLDAGPANYVVTLDLGVTLTHLDVTGNNSRLETGNFNMTVLGDLNGAGGRIFGLTGTGELRVDGTATFAGAHIQSINRFDSRGTLIFNSSGAQDDICDTGIDHGGNSARWDGNGDIRFDRGSTFVNGAASTFEITSSKTMFWPENGSRPTFTNNGTLVKSAGAGITFFDRMSFVNTGAMRAESGTLKTNGLDINLNGNTLSAGVWAVKNGATLSVVDLLDVPEVLLTNSADVTLDGVGSTFDALGSITTNAAAGKLTVTNGNQFQNSGDLQNDGLLTIGTNAQVRVNPGSSLTNLSAGTLTGGTFVVSGALVADGLSITTLSSNVTLDSSASTFEDENGTDAFLATSAIGASGVLAIQNGRDFTSGASLQNDGTLNVGTGTTFEVASGSTLDNVAGGTLDGGTFVVSGTLKADNLNVTNLGSSLTLDGATSQVLNGSNGNGLANLATIDTGGSLEIKTGRNFTTSGNFTVADTGTLTVGAGTLFRVQPGAGLSNFQSGELVDGVFNISGTLQADNAQIQIINTDVDLDTVDSQIIDGDGNDAFASLERVKVNGRFTIRNGRDVTTNSTITQDVGSRVKLGPALTRDASVLTVNGDYVQDGGVLSFDGGVLTTTGTVFLNGSLEGNGTINGDAVVNGEFGPGMSPGMFNIDGDVRFSETSSFVAELLGVQPGVSYDRLNITGELDLTGDDGAAAGLLEVHLGFVPFAGTYFDLIVHGSSGGRFERMELIGFGDGQAFLTYMPDRVRLTFVPAPSGGVCLLGLGGLLGRRRRG